jgi:hypothetical protein
MNCTPVQATASQDTQQARANGGPYGTDEPLPPRPPLTDFNPGSRTRTVTDCHPEYDECG